jgi:hypothetical protein
MLRVALFADGWELLELKPAHRPNRRANFGELFRVAAFAL